MNVAIAVHSYHRREGTGGYVVDLLPRIAAVHSVTLYAARIAETVPDGVTVVRVPAIMTRAATRMLTFPPAFRSVRGRHDVIHIQGWVAGSADVVTAHIVMAAWRDAAAAAGVRPPLGERVLGPFVTNREARLYRSGAGAGVGAGARHVIAPSQKVARELGRYYGREEDLSVVPHGFPSPPPPDTVDQDAARKRLGIPQSVFLSLYVGDPRKGLEVALEAVASQPDCHLAVVSHSPADPAIAKANSLGLGNRFHWIGALSDMADAYASASVLLHPTVYDSFGSVVAEAMAHGVPAIVTRMAGVSELIAHRQAGWIIQGERVAGAAAALAELRESARLRAQLGAGARAVAEGRGWDEVARETLEIYEQVVRR